MSTKPSREIQTFANPNSERNYLVTIECPEFTCVCPITGQPDFANIIVEYVPDKLCVELKSLKLYFWSFRDEGTFHEAVTNKILDELVSATSARYMKVTAKFNVRGGLYTTINAEHGKR